MVVLRELHVAAFFEELVVPFVLTSPWFLQLCNVAHTEVRITPEYLLAMEIVSCRWHAAIQPQEIFRYGRQRNPVWRV